MTAPTTASPRGSATTSTTAGASAQGLALLRARAADLALPVEVDEDRDVADLLVATVGGQSVAVPIERLRGVRAPAPLCPVPGSHPVLVGVAAGHAEALVVASLGGLLDLSPAVGLQEQWLVVLEDPVAPVGLLVDTADEIVRVPRQQVSAPPASSGALTTALTPSGLLLLDTAAVLRDPRLFLHPDRPTTQGAPWPDA